MSEAEETNLTTEIREATLKHLWRQWQAVGGATTGSGQANAIVDPEALILMSLWIMEHERRLADVLDSWVRLNSGLVSIQRLANLSTQFPVSLKPKLAGLALVGLEAKDARWKSLRSSGPASELGVRGNKRRAIEAPLRSFATLMLQLRRGMGVGAKADVLSYLLGTNVVGTEWASVSTITEELGYTTATVRKSADDLAAASFALMPTTGEGRSLQRMYAARPQQWVNVLGISTAQPGWGYWRERFLFLIAVLEWLESLSKRKVSSYARDVEARELLTKHVGAIQKDRIVDSVELSVSELNAQFLESATRQFIGWLGNAG